MILFILIFYSLTVRRNLALENIFCSLSSSDELMIKNIPTKFEFNLPYTVILSSNNSLLLSYIRLNIEYIDSIVNKSNDSSCHTKPKSSSSFIYKTEFVLKFQKNSTKSKCLQLKLHSHTIVKDIKIIDLCTNSSTDKIIDNDDKYDVQSYMRTINTTEVALQDNFNWLIFGTRVQQVWYTHEGMRLSRECDAAENGRVAIFNNPRGKRRLISHPIDVTNVSLIYFRLGSGTCPPPPPTNPPFQLLITTDCLNYTNWHVIYSQRVLPDSEYVIVPFSLNNITNSSIVCLKIEQQNDKQINTGSWFIDDLILLRSRLQIEYFSDVFQTMQPTNWLRLAGGHLKTCNERMSMVFESNPDIRTEIGATTIDISLSGSIDHDVLFHLSKNISIDWTKWNATGVLDLNKTCTDEDVITFNGENFRQLCSPIIELGRIDSVRFTLSTGRSASELEKTNTKTSSTFSEPCMKRNKYVPTPSAVIFLSVFYNVSSIGYSRTIRRILLNELKQTYKTFDVRFDELQHNTLSYGRICLSQYDHSSVKNVDVWSVRDFLALPLLSTNITHYIQLNLNTKCSSQQQQSQGINGAITSQNVNIEYSIDFGKNWNMLLQPCFLDSSCSSDVQHVYSSKMIFSSSDWHRVTLPLPLATLQQKYIRFRISTSAYMQLTDPWAIDRIYIGECFRACSGHGWCRYRSCQCDRGYSGEFCELTNQTLNNRMSFLIDNQTDDFIYQGGRFSYQCDILSQGKPLVFSKYGSRFLRISNINGSTPKLLEFTIRLGTTNSQCHGTNPTDLDRDLKSILLLTSCSNGIHWTIIDRFRISDILAPDYGTLSRILFEIKPENIHCLVEWRQMDHRGDNQDIWAIDDITIRDVPSRKLLKTNLDLQIFQSKLTYIRPGYVLYFRLKSLQRKVFQYDDIDLRINSIEIDLLKYEELFSYGLNDSLLVFILILPRKYWFQSVEIQLKIKSNKTFEFNFVHFGYSCEKNCWLNEICFEGLCFEEKEKSIPSLTDLSLNEEDILKLKINVIDEEVLLPFIDSTELIGLHFQTIEKHVETKTKLVLECSPNGGVKWFELDLSIGEKQTLLKDHYVPIPKVCQEKRTLFRWKNISIRLMNIAFVQSNIQFYFLDQFQKFDRFKWLYSTYSINSSSLYPNKLDYSPFYQIISSAITLQKNDYILMIDTKSNLNQTRLQIDYSIDNKTWQEFLDTDQFERPVHRFGQFIPTKLLRRTILFRIQSNQSFELNHIYLGPSCPSNCYGHGKCLWKNQESICQCDQNRTSNSHCLPNDSLLSSYYETFEEKLNSSLWTISSHAQITHRCYNRLSKITPYLCFLPNTHTKRAYAMIGPFQSIKYVIFKFGLQYITLTNCSNEILFQYSYDHGIQWLTKRILDTTENIFENFDDVKLNTNIYLRWIEQNDNFCLMWNLRSISIRTKTDETIWFDRQKNFEYQTWEYFLSQTSSIIQFQLEMFSIVKHSWKLELEISSDMINGWSNWIPLISLCNQTNIFCEDRIGLTGSMFLSELYENKRNVSIPIPDNYVNQQVRFRWRTEEKTAKFSIENVYIASDCPWFCSGHGLCYVNGCLCDDGYLLPYCSPDLSIVQKKEFSSMDLNENLLLWKEKWGDEKCSTKNDQTMFSKAGTRALISPEISLINIKYLRLQFDTCLNQTETFNDPILIQLSTNNGIFWETLMTIFYRQNSSDKSWLIDFSTNEYIQLHSIRIRLFQRVEQKWTSNWILKRFELIPKKLSNRWISSNISVSKTCNYKHMTFPMEIYSTNDIELNDTSFLIFQLDNHPCLNDSSVTPNRSQFYLEYSIDHGQNWLSIDRPSTIISKINDIILTQPLRARNGYFYLPIHAYQSLSKFIRIRWLAMNSTIASRWIVKNVTIRSECDILCEFDTCNGKCYCLKMPKCSTIEQTFYERFNHSFELFSDIIFLPPLNLISTRFLEFHFHFNCQQSNHYFSLQYSRNLGLTWHLFRFYYFHQKQFYILHEDFLDEMRYDHILIRLVFQTNLNQCFQFDQIIVSGTSILQNRIYAKFDRSNHFQRNVFLSFGEGIFNGSYLIYSNFSHKLDKLNSTSNEIITDDLMIFEREFFLQLAVSSLVFKRCINIRFSFSNDYGSTWKSIDHDENLFFDDQQNLQIFTWKFSSTILGSNQVRFRLQFDDDEQYHIAISEFYIGSNCPHACHGHGMCLNNSQCRCNPGWTNMDCSLSLVHFPNEINVLQEKYSTSYGAIEDQKCGLIFNNTCKREFRSHFLDINHPYTYIHIEITDQCLSKASIRKNGDGWIRLQYREMNTLSWTTLHIFKDDEFNVTKLIPSKIVQFRLIQDTPIVHRHPWSIEQFSIFHIHTSLQWIAEQIQLNTTFLTIKNQTFYETKDVYMNLNSILQIEYNDTNFHQQSIEYSLDFGLTWRNIFHENTSLKFFSIQSQYENKTSFRLTISFNFISILRFHFRCSKNHLQYFYIGNKCPMNCYGYVRCINGECQMNQPMIPLTDFREIFENNWLQFEYSKHAITRPIDLRLIRAIKWIYDFEYLSKICQTSIYFLISTDGTLTWSILHQIDLPMKNPTKSIEIFIDIESLSTKYHIGQFRWYQINSSKCQNFTWSLRNILTIKTINIYFLTDFFYTISSSRLNWESIDGALLAHIDQCNNNIPAFIFNDISFSAVTVPILIQDYYVLVFQINTQCHVNLDSKCGNQTSLIEYKIEYSSNWLKLVDMSDLTCRTSLINGGYFSIHTIKLPHQTYSSGTQFRWMGTQAKGEQWSMNSLFIGECPEYCHDRGLCTVTGCQCAIGYSGTYCENYVGSEALPTSFNETFDDLSTAGMNVASLNNWIKLSSDGHIRHVCDEDANNITNDYLNGQALHFGAGCGCGSVEAITRELNITQATTISFAFHVTMKDNCKLTINNITVALEWTYDEGISWKRLVTMYNKKRAQFFNITLPSEMMKINEQHRIGGIRFRWTQIERPSNDTYWAIDNIRLK